MRRFHLSSLLLPVAVISVGCEDASTPEPTFTVLDSAGIEIVESSAPLLGPDAWTISEEPVLQIGEVEGEDPYLFADISGSSGTVSGKVFRLDDSRIVVCNGMDSTIRFFDERGWFIRSIGGRGEGPGEFDAIWACLRVNDGFAVLGSPSDVAVFDGEGRLVQSARIAPIEDRRAVPRGVLSNRSYLATSGVTRREDLGPGINPIEERVSVVSPDGHSSEFLFGMKTSLWNSDSNSGIVRFGPRGLVRASGDEILYGWPEEYDLRFLDPQGRLIRIVRRAWDLAPVTEEDRQWARDFYVNGNSLRGREDSPSEHQARLRIAEGMAFSEYHAVYDNLLVDQSGHVWVRRQHPRWDSAYWVFNVQFPYSWTWDVFDSEGRWVTSLSPPGSMEIHDIGEDYILGVWKDEIDVEYVRMYSLDRGS